MMKSFFLKLLPCLLFLLISGLLIFSWFRDGQIYGGGDVGLQTYNPQRTLENASFAWWESTAPGSPSPQGLSAVPFQFILYLLQSVGFSPLMLQATLFFVLLFLMGFGMYLFLKEKMQNHPKFYPIIGGIFYMLNPYMMIQVWHRFIHTTIVLAAVLPFLAIFWEKWIRSGHLKYLLFFLLTSILSTYVFGTYAYIITVWVFLLLVTLPALVPWQDRKVIFRICARFLLGLIFWVLINCWWLLPVLQISPATLSQQHNAGESLTTLVNISAQAILPYTLQLVNPFYLFYQEELGTIYKNLFFQLIPWLFVGIILIGLFRSLKNKIFSLYGIFYLISIFLVKGAAPPFGSLYIFGFQNFFALGVMRNPFEKLGLILVFFATTLFTLGLLSLTTKYKRASNLFMFLTVFLILIFSFPMWIGKVIGTIDKPAFVEVPQSYTLANLWLKSQKNAGISDGKILHLPLTTGESITYKWQHGYSGLEPSDTFFTAFPSISRGFNIQRIDDTLSGLALSFQVKGIPHSEIVDYLQAFNIRFIVLHKDIDWMGMGLENPQDLEQFLDTLEFLDKKRQFGDLVVYQLKDAYFKSKITFEHDFTIVYPGEENLSFWPNMIKAFTSRIVSPLDQKPEVSLSENSRQTFIFPKVSLIYGVASDSASPFEHLARMQTIFQQAGMIQSLEVSNKIFSLNLRSGIDGYEQGLKQIFSDNLEIANFQTPGQESILSGIFRMHLIALKELLNGSSASVMERVRQVIVELGEYLNQFNLKPKFHDNDTSERQVFKFNIPIKGAYELVMLDPQVVDLYTGSLNRINFLINDSGFVLNSKKDSSVLSFGNLNLEQGDLEISYPLMLSGNLTSFVGEEKLTHIEIPVNKKNSSGIYRFSFEAQTDNATGFYVQLYEDNKISVREFLQPTVSNWQKFQINFQINPHVSEAKIVIETVGGIDGQPAMVSIRDVKVQRILTNQVLLRTISKDISITDSTDELVTYSKQSPVLYEGKINILNPGILFFRETFHPGWKLILTKDAQSFELKNHYLGDLYDNGWYIKDSGKYNFKIYFDPQNNFYIGIFLSGLGIIGLCAYGFLVRRIREDEK